MKKVISLICVLFISTIAVSAQGFVQFRLEAGPSFNFSHVEHLTKHNKTGYHLGAYVDVPVYHGVYVGSGLTFSMKGGRYSVTDNNTTNNQESMSSITLHYLQVPVNVGYRFNVSRSLAIALQTGPYFSVALAGSYKTGLGGVKQSYDIFKEGVLNLFKAKRFDVGWGLQAMAYIDRFYATAGMDFGFLNVLNDGENKTLLSDLKKHFSMNTMQCFVGLGICF